MGAWLYDLLVIAAIERLAIIIVISGIEIAIQIGFSIEGYTDISDYLTRDPIISPLFIAYVFIVAAFFYTYFWARAGQTVGMKAWKLQVISEFDGNLTFAQTLIRMATACLGLGNILTVFNSNNRFFLNYFSHS
ncbi:transmembrane protein [Candidatus Enterovibrio altilux]|uniref:Transmembrane protein n=2 Tax=Candidatus Enterovibrio altilux TaxID=1927128 RepID=A0A291BBN3_9GAMM|nr:transmembrane protein [Candidatus Enterovibrio luxaltus]